MFWTKNTLRYLDVQLQEVLTKGRQLVKAKICEFVVSQSSGDEDMDKCFEDFLKSVKFFAVAIWHNW